MRLLRDVRESTRLLLLLEITTRQHSRMKSLADTVDLTVQGVSDYLKGLTEEGLIHREAGVYRPTMDGVALLQERFRELREFVEHASGRMRILDFCSALAGSDIQEAERVGLFMEDGYLVAHPGRTSPSQGKALHAARRGEDVAVVELEGMVDLPRGTITVLRLPGARGGGTQAVDEEQAKRILRAHRHHRLGVSDAVARALAEKLGRAVDFEFAVAAAAVEAAQRGLDVLLLASEDSLGDVLAGLEAAGEGAEQRVPYEVEVVGRSQQR